MKLLASSPGELVIDLGGTTWTLRAAQDELLMRLEAADDEALTSMSAHVADRIEQIGRRDGLHVRWEVRA